MSSSMVNDRGGANHIKFNKLAQRLSKVNTDIIHRGRGGARGALDAQTSAAPATGNRGCHFQDELERCKALGTCSRFKRFYYAVWPLCQSLPELYHHIAKVAAMLEEQVVLCAAPEVGTFMQLISVLARDLQEDIWPYFHRLFAALTQKLNAVMHATPGSPSPELTGQLFECLSYLIKYTMATLVDDHDSMRQYYGVLLGNATAYVRDMSARCLVLLVRKLKQTAFVSHIKRLLKAVAGQFRQVADTASLPIATLEAKDSGGCSSEPAAASPRMMHLIEGVALLLHHTSKGIRGCMHSKGSLRLTLAMELMMPIGQEVALEVLAAAGTTSSSSSSSSAGKKSGKNSSSYGSSSSFSGSRVGVALAEASPRALSTFSPAVQQAYSGKEADDDARKRKELLTYCSGQVMCVLTTRIFRHVHPRNMAQLWLTLLDAVANLVVQFRSLTLLANVSPTVSSCAECSMLHCVEIVTWCLTHSNGRGLSDKAVKGAVGKRVVQVSLDLVECIFVYLQIGIDQPLTRDGRGARADALMERNRSLFCRVWLSFPRDASLLLRVDALLAYGIKSLVPTPAVLVFSNELFGTLPSDLVKKHLVHPVLQAAVDLVRSDVAADVWLVILLEIFLHLKDVRGGLLGATTSEAAEIGADITEMGGAKRAKKKDKSEDWDAMDYENESGDEDTKQDSDEHDEALKKLLKSCSKELLLLAGASVQALQKALVDASQESSDSRNIGVLACMVLRWIIKAFPVALLNQLNKSEQYTSLRGLLASSLTANFAAFSAQVDSAFLAQSVVLVCAEKEGGVLDDDSLRSVLRSYAQHFAGNSNSLSCSWGLLELLRHLDARQGHRPDLALILGADLASAVFDAISGTISTPSYWLRLHLLHIAAYFAAPQLVPHPEGKNDKKDKADEVATVDIISLLLDAASTSPHLSTEREYARRMGSLEVLVRGQRLPPAFLKLVCSFCLSMLHTKFQPFWEPTITVLVAAGGFNEGETVLWPLLMQSIVVLGARGVDGGGEGADDQKAAKKKNEAAISKQKMRLPIDDEAAGEGEGEGEEEQEQEEGENGASEANKKPFLHACLSVLSQLDDGELPVPVDVATSKAFYYLVPVLSTDVLVAPDSRADADTAYQSSWAILRRVPAITMKRSKVVVPMFVSFLLSQYYRVFSTDPELPWLRHVGIFAAQSPAQSSDALESEAKFLLPLRILKARLKMFLQVFAQVTSPRSLFQHKFLFSFYIALLSNPEASTSLLALDCLCTYKPVYLLPFKENFKKMLDDRHMRDELVTFDISIKNSAIDPAHRGDFIPLIVRLIHGRFAARAKSSRASKEQSLARRTAVLTFLSSLELSEQVHFVQLMYRTLIPKEQLMEIALCPPGQEQDRVSLAQQHMAWYDAILQLLAGLKSDDMQKISWERQAAFLHLLQQVIRILGFSVAQHVPVFTKLVILMLTNAQAVRGVIDGDKEADVEEPEAEEEEEVETGVKSASHNDIVQSLRVRTLCLSRLAELVHQFRTVFDFARISAEMMRPLYPLLESMPQSIAGSTKPPALLRILHALVQYPETISVVSENIDTVTTVIRCVGSRVDFEVAKVVMDVITRLLDFNQGESILPHAPLIIQAFSKRFVGANYNEVAELKLSELNIVPSGSVKQELNLLCRIAEGVFTRTDVVIAPRSVSNLATLLLGMLRTYTTNKKVRVEETWVGDILRIYRTLLPRMDDVQPHVAFISRLFGPAGHSQSLFNNANIRCMLASAYADLSKHPSTNGLLLPSAAAIVNLVKIDSTLLGRNFSSCMPIFQALSAENTAFPVDLPASDDVHGPQRIEGWSSLLGYSPATRLLVRNGQMCTVVLYECLRCMSDEEMVVRTAAQASIKVLVKDVSMWNASIEGHSGNGEAPDQQKVARWSDILLSTLMPAIRKGLKEANDQVKKGFISVLSCVVRTLGLTQAGSDEPFFHADLLQLLHEDPEQDFFENITHIQTHRRVRALMKLRTVLTKSATSSSAVKLADLGIEELERSDETMDMEVEERAAASRFAGIVLSSTSLVHVLLPLAFHPLISDDFVKKDHTPLMHEAAHFLGAIALHLTWTQYFAQIKFLLKQLERSKADKEKILLLALCSLLDGFHFDMSGDEEAEDINVPSLRGEAPAEKKNATEEEVPVATAEDLEASDKVAREGHAPAATGKNISQIVINSVMPWVQVFLLKDEKDHKGNDSKVVRTGVAVALSKLICRLQVPVVPEKKKLALFMNLVIRVVGTLKSRDTSARDQARDSLSKMLITMGISFFKPVLYELQHSLTEGYQRHVCNYTIRSLLSTVMEALNYSPPLHAMCIPVLEESDSLEAGDLVKPEFDSCIPMLMESVMDDLNGDALDDREAEGAVRQTIREAKGSKANEILEMTARALLFRPTYALKCIDDPKSVSSLHALSSPMLEALSDCEDADLIGRINEGLQRVALGLAKNPSMVSSELLLYLHATLQPFVAAIIRDYEQHKRSLGMLKSNSSARELNASDAGDAEGGEGDDDGFLDDLPSYLKEESSDEEDQALYTYKKKKGDNVTGYKATTWLPTDRRSHTDQKAVIEQRNREIKERDQVLDGASAPKLTGSSRHRVIKSKSSSSATAGGGSDPAAIVAVKFCLTLFLSAMKRNLLDSTLEETRTMCRPFIPLLGQCLRIPGAANVVALSMRCLCALLSWNLSVEASFSRAVGARMMKVMFRGGVLLSTDNELVQACIRGLTSLFDLYNMQVETRKTGNSGSGSGSQAKRKASASSAASNAPTLPLSHPLSEENTRTLLKMMTISIMEVTSSYQNAAFQLIKSIIQARILVPEIYDLVTKLTEQIVLSQRKGVRSAATQIVVDFMTSYPLGEKRLQGHMKQLIANCSFEHEDGRQATLETLQLLCKNLPLAALEDHAQMIFLPMTLRLVNDASSSCRETAAGVITALGRRVGGEMFGVLLGYAVKWISSGDAAGATSSSAEPALDSSMRALIRTGAQCSGLLVTARPDLIKKSPQFHAIIKSAARGLLSLMHLAHDGLTSRGSLEKREMAKFDEGVGEAGGTESWAAIYHVLVMLETFYTHLPSGTDSAITHFSSSTEKAGPQEVSSVGGKKRKQADAQSPPPAAPGVLVMEIVQEAMLYPHAWVRAAASRVLGAYLLRRDVTRSRLATSGTGTEILLQPNALYHLARRLCIVLNQPVLSDSLLSSTSLALVFAIRAMFQNTDLAVLPEHAEEEQEEEEQQPDEPAERAAKAKTARVDDDEDDHDEEEDGDGEEEDGDGDGDGDGDVDEDGEEEEKDGASAAPSAPSASAVALPKTGASWTMQRLRGLGVDSRGNRRQYVLTVLRQLVAACNDAESASFLREHLSQMIEVAMRSHLAASGPDLTALKALKEQAGVFLDELEAKVGAALYIGTFSEVQRRVETSKANKRRLQALDAVTNPTAFAMAKIAKRKRDAESKKRKQLKNGSKGSKRSKSAAIVYEDA